MDEALLQALINKYLSGIATAEEQQLLENWYESSFPDHIIIPFSSEQEKKELLDRMRTRLKAYAGEDERHGNTGKRRGNYFAAAACIIILVGSILLYRYSAAPRQNEKPQTVKNDVLPGYDGAILTLADGSQHILDSVNNGVIATDAGSSISKKGSQIIYNNISGQPQAVAYNVLSVPKGRQFKIVLPDGTGVWLNSASLLRYPTVFAGKERVVELEGEAYFEVIHNVHHPFVVKINNTKVEDIGTAFNINAYTDEPSVKTTLVKGSVKVSNNKVSRVLDPGEQAVTGNDKLVVYAIDTSQVLAWKDGFFQFDDADMHTIMQQLSRWYNIEVIFEGNITPRKFYGRINRNMKLSSVLNLLEQNQIHFDIETGNKLIVKP